MVCRAALSQRHAWRQHQRRETYGDDELSSPINHTWPPPRWWIATMGKKHPPLRATGSWVKNSMKSYVLQRHMCTVVLCLIHCAALNTATSQAEFLAGRSLSTLSTDEWAILKDLEHQLRLRKVQQKQSDLLAWLEESRTTHCIPHTCHRPPTHAMYSIYPK